jgi:hypothetical protein
MNSQANINDQVRQAVRERAKSAGSEREIGNIIFACLAEEGIPWQQADRESVKVLLVDAVRAYRNSRDSACSFRVAV